MVCGSGTTGALWLLRPSSDRHVLIRHCKATFGGKNVFYSLAKGISCKHIIHHFHVALHH